MGTWVTTPKALFDDAGTPFDSSVFEGWVGRSFDSLSIDDSLVKSDMKVLTEDLMIDDSFSRIWDIICTLEDHLSIDDSLVKDINKALGDNVNLDDSLVNIVTKILTDHGTIDDSLVTRFEKVLSDNMTVDDSISKIITKILIDNINLDDSTLAKYITLASWVDSLNVIEDGLGDLIHASGNWIGHIYFNLGNLSPYVEDQVDTGGWTKTVITSGGWTPKSEPSTTWAKTSITSGAWTKKTIGV